MAETNSTDKENQTHQSAWTQSISTKDQVKIIARVMKYALPFKSYFLIALVFSAFLATINILLPRLLQYFMDHFLNKGNTAFNIILDFAALYFLGTVLKAILQFFSNYLYSMGSEKTLENVRLVLFKKLHTLGMRYFDLTPAGSIVSRVTNDTMSLMDFLAVFASVLTGLFAIITAFIAMYTTNSVSAWIVLGFLPILLLAIWYYSHYSSRVYRHMREKLSELNVKLNESIEGINIIQEFRQEKRISDEFEATNQDYLNARKAMIRTNSLLLSSLINLLYALAIVAVLTHFGLVAQNQFVEAGVIYAFTTYVSNFFNPMSDMMDSLSSLQDGVVASSRILRILDDQTYAPAQNEGAHGEIKMGKIEFRHVSFSYDGKNKILNDISFVANPGETIGIVGHTGSGKSSIINVMMRFYEFYEGQILIDDRDIKDYPMSEIRRKIGLVLQDSFMFYGDISSNIRLFNQDISDEQVYDAAKFVQADRFIEKLPGKYHARVIEGGAKFSSGERQLLSFARTVVTDPKILVLDEATASIDTETETLIQEGLHRIRQGRTTIAIAHRLSTIRDAEQIIVLDAGKIVEMGSHDELLAKHGHYYQLYQLQQGQN
ncbi:ABC transporter ATP-binding protein [Lapidilactobacillus bayanensis]|uniref:ABC transporter ATP-binding protein n=1 Tax=Lapidilactobacillus bayanensis TaxID=2485998 RepID=UPI001CDD2E39|nr:ABC transporter ATP-binding protein [Lapidilactobacillus bayanensis]